MADTPNIKVADAILQSAYTKPLRMLVLNRSKDIKCNVLNSYEYDSIFLRKLQVLNETLMSRWRIRNDNKFNLTLTLNATTNCPRYYSLFFLNICSCRSTVKISKTVYKMYV